MTVKADIKIRRRTFCLAEVAFTETDGILSPNIQQNGTLVGDCRFENAIAIKVDNTQCLFDFLGNELFQMPRFI